MNAMQAQQMAAARGFKSVKDLIHSLRTSATELRGRPVHGYTNEYRRRERERLHFIADINDREADSLTQYQ